MKTLIAALTAICTITAPLSSVAQDQTALTQETQDRIAQFTNRMRDWGYSYSDLAGAENIGVSYDDDIVDQRMIIEGGDWVVFDRRLCSGAYGVSHEDASITPVALVDPGKFDLSCFEPVITSQVDAITLMQRYQWFVDLFINWDHRLTPSPLRAGGWDGFADIEASYQTEKPELPNDPHLTLYWLMHFGFTLDQRYDDVKAIVEMHDLAAQLDVIADAIAFFDNLSPYEDIEIKSRPSDDGDFEEIFLKRRAYLMYNARSYRYASGAEGLDAWWYSVSIYPKPERYMIQRMRWLGNNLKEGDQWQAFSDLIAQDARSSDISLLSYVLALNPDASPTIRQSYAETFLHELIVNEQLWKNSTERQFGQVMIWDMRNLIADKDLLQTATDIYFANDTISEQFQDINLILNGPDANADIPAARELIATLAEAADAYDRFKATDEQRNAFWTTIDATLDQARAGSDELLFRVTANINDKDVQKRALRYLFVLDSPKKSQAFKDLYVKLEPSERDIVDLLNGIFPNHFSGADDPNIIMARQLFLIPETNYRNDWAARNGREAATVFFLGSVHWPENFDFFMDVIMDPAFNDMTDLKASIFTHLLSQDYDTDINSTHAMSQEQLEVMLDTISDVLRQPGWEQYPFFQEAIRAIYYQDNPSSKDWMERHYNNIQWLETFPDVALSFETLRGEINMAIEASLEFIAEREAQ